MKQVKIGKVKVKPVFEEIEYWINGEKYYLTAIVVEFLPANNKVYLKLKVNNRLKCDYDTKIVCDYFRSSREDNF